jgi:AcrR family transcriptional regulator
MEDIAAEATVAKGLLYRHFPSKEALFHALMEERGAEFTARLREAWDGVKRTPGSSPWALVDAGLQTFIDEVTDPNTMINWVEPAQWELVSAYRDQTLQAIVDELVQVLPTFDRDKAWLVAAVFQGSLEGGVLEWRRRGGASREEIFRIVRAFALRGLEGVRVHFDMGLSATPPVTPSPASSRAAAGTARAPRRAQAVDT